MTETTFTFRVDQDLKSAFADAARAQDRTAAQLLRTLMRDVVRRQQAERDHDAWFRHEVERAMREADDPNMERIGNDVVKRDVAQQRAELLARIEAERE
jgi:predicted transcriptional regulator